MITPTVGRVLWFYPEKRDTAICIHDPAQACSASVAFVHNERLVNLLVADHNGTQFARQNIVLVQDGDPTPIENYAEWMPFQKGQAQQTAATEGALVDRVTALEQSIAKLNAIETALAAATQANPAKPPVTEQPAPGTAAGAGQAST